MHQRMEVLMEQKRMQEAIETGIKAEQILLKIESIPELFSLYRDLALCYAAIEDYKTAYTYQQQQLQLNEQLFTKRKQQQLLRLSSRFNGSRKKKRICYYCKKRVKSKFMLVNSKSKTKI
jgi:tetratricopeptide (TPR) repeat protein